MSNTSQRALKVGGFTLAILLVLAYGTVRISQDGLFRSRGYPLYAVMNSAEGLTPKTPVEIAGIQVGSLGPSELVNHSQAKITLYISDDVKVTRDASAQVRTKGFLGESYIEIKQGNPQLGYLAPGEMIETTNPFTDLSELSGKLSTIADDVKSMTSSIRGLFADTPDGKNAPVKDMLLNFRDFSKDLKDFTHANKGDMNRVVANLAALTQELRMMVAQNRGELTDSMQHIRSIAEKIDEGRGTLGKLINDETTIKNLDEAVESLKDTLGGVSSFQLSMGYHLEFMPRSGDFKNYVDLGLRTRPDRAFLFEFVSDPSPAADHEFIVNNVTANGITTTSTTERITTKPDQFLFSAQVAQNVGDFTVRGGIIESRAGVGLDWTKGFLKASVSAFDFRNDNGSRPHLKAWGTLNVTRNLFLMGGIDDPLNPNTPTDWFMGAGLQFVDNDVKSLLGLGAAAAK